jgi:hypothetical protein
MARRSGTAMVSDRWLFHMTEPPQRRHRLTGQTDSKEHGWRSRCIQGMGEKEILVIMLDRCSLDVVQHGPAMDAKSRKDRKKQAKRTALSANIQLVTHSSSCEPFRFQALPPSSIDTTNPSAGLDCDTRVSGESDDETVPGGQDVRRVSKMARSAEMGNEVKRMEDGATSVRRACWRGGDLQAALSANHLRTLKHHIRHRPKLFSHRQPRLHPPSLPKHKGGRQRVDRTLPRRQLSLERPLGPHRRQRRCRLAP